MIAEADIASACSYVASRVGKPWAKRAQGPDQFDCGGIFRDAQRVLFDRDVPIIDVDADNQLAVVRAIADHPLRTVWQEVRRPAHGDAVFLSRRQTAHHVGVYLDLDRGGLLHSVQGSGVRFDRLFTLGALGWFNLSYWRAPA